MLEGLPPHCQHDYQIPRVSRATPVNMRPYHYPHYKKREIEKLVEDLLNSGVIRPSMSSYSSPVLLIKKLKGSWHLYVDYQALNQLTIENKFLIPVINELLDELHGSCIFSKLFSKLDVYSRYHQICMALENIQKETKWLLAPLHRLSSTKSTHHRKQIFDSSY